MKSSKLGDNVYEEIDAHLYERLSHPHFDNYKEIDAKNANVNLNGNINFDSLDQIKENVKLEKIKNLKKTQILDLGRFPFSK